MDEDIVINVEFEGGNLPVPNVGNVQVVPANLAWEDFELMLKVFSDQEYIQVFYVDDEDDVVTICSEEELKEAFKVAKLCNNTLNIKVQCDLADSDDFEPGVSNLAPAPDPVENAVDPCQITEDIVAALDSMLDEPEREEEEDKPAAEDSAVDKKMKLFFLKNEATGDVLDINGWKNAPGAVVVAWPQKQLECRESVLNQLWYEDERTGTIRSAWNRMCLTAAERELSTGDEPPSLAVFPYRAGVESQQWRVHCMLLQHRMQPAWVLEQQGGAMHVTAAHFQDTPLQRWQQQFYDQENARKKRTARPTSQVPVDYLSRLAQEVGNMTMDGGPERSAAMDPNVDSEVSPIWFTREMDKMKGELAAEVSIRVAQLTVRQVLQGLEGAVVSSMSVPTTTSPTPLPSRTHSMDSRVRYSHDGIICDHCDGRIVGVRFKCGNCEDYDLCEGCEALAGVHDDSHVFLALRRPAPSAGRRPNGRMAPLLTHNIYNANPRAEKQKKRSSNDEPFTPCCEPSLKDLKAIERLKRKEEKLKNTEEKLKNKEEKRKNTEEKLKNKEEKRKKTEDKLKRRLEGEERPSKKERLDLPQFKMSMRMSAVFLGDESFPDGSHVPPGTKLLKKWRVRNDGTHAWSERTHLKMVWGNMEPMQPQFDVLHLKVNEVGTVSAEIVAPRDPGTYQSHWRLVHNGVRFGHRIWCSVVVDPAELLEVPAAPTTLEEEEEEEEEEQGPKEVEEVRISEEKVKVVLQGQTDEDFRAAEENVGEEEKYVVPSSTIGQQQAPAALPPPGPSQEQRAMELTAQDILSFEMLNIGGSGDRPAPRMSQTATPNNTPLESRDVTPPKSPVPEEMEKVAEEDEDVEEEEEEEDSSSSVEVVGVTPRSEVHPLSQYLQVVGVTPRSKVTPLSQLLKVVGCPPGSEVHPLSQYVQDKMASLESAAGLEADVESLSSYSGCSDDSDEQASDQDYYIVPIPDCFYPALPASKSASTSIYVMKEDVESKRTTTIDEMLTASRTMATPPMEPSLVPSPTVCSMDSQASVTMVTAENQASVAMVAADSQASPATATIDSQTPRWVVPRGFTTVDMLSQTASWLKVTSTADCQTVAPATADCQTATTTTATADCQTTTTTTVTADCQTTTTTVTSDCQTATTGTSDCETSTEGTSVRTVDSQTRPVGTSDAQLQASPQMSQASSQQDPEEEDEEEHKYEDAQGDLSSDDNDDEEKEDDTEAKVPVSPAANPSPTLPEAQHRMPISSSSLVTAAIGAASQAAASAFSTAKDVFHTLQYVPPQSSQWTPKPDSQWTPKQPQWYPPTEEDDDWSPPNNPCDEPQQLPRDDSEEMAQLLEMGFANRQLNSSLLDKHGDDLERVIQELITGEHNDWHTTRH